VSDFRATLRAELVAAAARPVPRAHRLPRPDRPTLLRAGAFALAAAAIALAIVVLPWGAQHNPQPTITGPQLPGTPLFGGSLDPGVRYHTRALQPQISFRANGDRWFVQDATSPTVLALQWREGSPASGGETVPVKFLAFIRLPRVIDPSTGDVQPAPDDLVGWLRADPDLGITSAARTTLGGRPATRLAFHIPRHLVRRVPQCEFTKVTVSTEPPQLATCTQITPDFVLPVNAAGSFIVPDGRDPLVAVEISLVPSRVHEIARDSAPLLDGLLIGR
jgi:hypothetical protein